MNLKRFICNTLKKFQIDSFSLGFKEDWQLDFEWIVKEDIKGNRYSYSYGETMTVLLEVKQQLTKEEIAYFQDLFEVIYVLKSLYHKENEIQKLQEGIQAIVTKAQVDELLENILQNAISAVPAASTGILTLYNEETNLLENIATVGLNKELLQAKFKIGEAIVGKIFVEGKSKLFTNKEELYPYLDNVTSQNLALIESEKKLYQSSGIIAVPIKMSDKTVGVILLHQQENQWSFSELDVKTIEHFASQMALAIYNARMYYQLQERESYLSLRNQIHDRLITLSLCNKGVPAILKEMQSILQMQLFYYDYIYNKDIQMASYKKESSFFEELLLKFQGCTEADYVTIQGAIYYAQPVIIDHIIVAVLVVKASAEISETEVMMLEQCAVMISLEILKKQSMMDRYLKHNQELFHRISNAPDKEAMDLLNQVIEYDANHYFCMIVVQLEKIKQSISSELELRKLIVAIEQQLVDYDIFLYGTNNQITVFVAYHDEMKFKVLKQVMTTFLNNFSTFSRVSVHVGMSTTHHDLSRVKRLTDEAQRACDYAVRKNSSRIVTFESLGINTLFLTQSKEYMESFVDDIFGPLDREKNDLSVTLRAYVANHASPKKAADQLFIHINTFYQRLNKIEKILNLSFNDQEDYLKIQLACYLYDNYIL